MKKSPELKLAESMEREMTDADLQALKLEIFNRQINSWIADAKTIIDKFSAEQTRATAGFYVPNGIFEAQQALHRATIGNTVMRRLKNGMTLGAIHLEAQDAIVRLAAYGSRSTNPYEAINDRHVMEAWTNVLELTK